MEISNIDGRVTVADEQGKWAWYMLKAKRVHRTFDFVEWSQWNHLGDRRVDSTQIMDARGIICAEVSTVFIGGLKLPYAAAPLFETRVFGRVGEGETETTSTWSQAQHSHDVMVARIDLLAKAPGSFQEPA